MATFAQFFALDLTDTYPGAKIYHYAAGTTTDKDVYLDRAKASAATQPLLADSRGVATFYGDGLYKLVIQTTGEVVLYTWDNINIGEPPVRGKGATLASASSLALGTDGDYFQVSGSSTINGLVGVLPYVTLEFQNALTLVHSGTFLLRGGIDYTTASGDVVGFVKEGATNTYREIYRTGSFPTTGVLTTKGDLITHNGTLDVRKAIGTPGQVLATEASHAHGNAWKTLTAGAGTLSIVDAATTLTFNAMSMYGAILNGTITSTVASSALTIALKGFDGEDPSPANPVHIAFHATALNNGTYNIKTVTAALSIVVPSATTLGTTNGAPARLYFGFLDNGTVKMCIWNPLVAPGLKRFSEMAQQSTIAIAAGNSAGVLYSDAIYTTKPFRVGGYIEISEATAGTWATASTVQQLMGPGVNRTGDMVNYDYVQSGAVATGATTTPFDNTVPLIGEGTQVQSLTVTATSLINRWHVTCAGIAGSDSGGATTIALFQDAGNCLAAVAGTNPSTATGYYLHHEMAINTISASAFRLRIGADSGNMTWNGTGGTQLYLTTAASSIEIKEIFT